jgi:hypothetical protein
MGEFLKKFPLGSPKNFGWPKTVFWAGKHKIKAALHKK